MPQIPSYPAKTVPNNADQLIIQDSVAANTKSITREAFLSGAPLPANTVNTQAIADASVTDTKLSTSAIALAYAEKTALQGSITSEVVITGLTVYFYCTSRR